MIRPAIRWNTPALLLLLIMLAASACKSTKKTAAAAPEEPKDMPSIDLGEVHIVAAPLYKATPEKFFALSHVQLDLRPDWKNHQLQGEAILKLAAYAYPQDTLVLNARGFTIGNISAPERTAAATSRQWLPAQRYAYDNRKLRISLGRKYNPGDTFFIRINYVARPEDELKNGLIAKKSNQGLFFINPEGLDTFVPREMWSQGESVDNSAWFPNIEANNQKYTQEILLTVDKQFTTLSNGSLEYSTLNKDGTRTDCWVQNLPSATYLTMIAVGNWMMVKDRWRDSLEVNYYVEPEYAPYAKLVFGHTPEMIEFFSRILGYDYPWQKFSQVVAREFVAGAMENTSAVIHFQGLQHDDRAHLDETYESVVSHELFHHWFGDLVTCKNWANLTLNESFATLGELLWTEHKYGHEAMQAALQQDIFAYLGEAITKTQPIVYYYYADPDDMFDRHRYEKGGVVLNMLRNYLGDKVFFNALHIYLTRNAFGNATIDQLKEAFEKASGKDMNWFFDQWYMRAGHPFLNITQEYRPAEKQLYVAVKQKQAAAPKDAYRIPVTIDIHTAQGVQHHAVELKNMTDTFRFSLEAAPLLVDFNPEKDLLALKDEIKSKEQWYYQYYHAMGYSGRYEALQALARARKDMGKDSMLRLAQSAMQDPSINIRTRAIEDLLPGLPAELKEQLRSTVQQMALGDKNARVRVSAIDYIRETQGKDAADLYWTKLNDSSYAVVADCIRALKAAVPRTDSARLLTAFAKLENTRSPEINMSLMETYNLYPDAGKLSFYHKALKYMYSYHASRYTDYYARLLLHTDAATIQSEKDFIIKLGYKEKDAFARLTYKNMLNELVKKLSAEQASGHATLAPDKIDVLKADLQKHADAVNLNSAD